jgi:hypothetical protein
MTMAVHSFQHARIKPFPLDQRKSLTTVDQILIDPDGSSPDLDDRRNAQVRLAAEKVRAAREKDAAVILFYGAHLLKNGAALLLERLMAGGWITHLATNGAGTIHDWEYAWLGRSTESVRENVATGTFGTWDETGRNIHAAILAGGLRGDGYGQSLGRFITEDGTEFPSLDALESAVRSDLADPLNGARADVIQAIRNGHLDSGQHAVHHEWKKASILGHAYRNGIPLTVHPGIGYDIIANHPIFNGAAIGRAATVDFHTICQSIDNLTNGVVLSIGSAIMAPQVFEKAISCVNNVRLQDRDPIIRGHDIFVVDLQDGGNWDWSTGEPPKTNPAYYLRFCKSFDRMGGAMHYVQSDNIAFTHNLLKELEGD